LRLLPDIRYGTEGYPESVARRLRAINLASWIAAAISLGFAVVRFFDPTPGVWKAAIVNAVAAPLFASVPLRHRFGPIAGPAFSLGLAYAYLFVVLSLVGTGTGMQMLYLACAGITFVTFGTERLLLAVVFGIAAAILVIIVEIAVPHDTGLLAPVVVFGSFVALGLVLVGPAVAAGQPAATPFPTFELTGFPISPVQVQTVGPDRVEEQTPTPMLTLRGMPASPHQLGVLGLRPEATGTATAANLVGRPEY
jgi:hypothetical protein